MSEAVALSDGRHDLARRLRRRALIAAGAALGSLAAAVLARAATGAPPLRVVFIAQDFRNSGVAAVYRSFQEACGVLGWQFSADNGAGDAQMLRELFAQAIGDGLDGVVLGGIDAADLADLVGGARSSRPVVVGWHATSSLRQVPLLFANVSTELKTVAEMAIDMVVKTAPHRAGVVLINDDRFEFANVKTQRMREALAQHPTCALLAVQNVSISRAAREIPGLMATLQGRFGTRWTHVVAINDIYFESMTYPLNQLGRGDILGIAAGDGSASAMSRIATGRATQIATVAEPLGEQGWQLADELVRGLTGRPPSGHVAEPIVVTTAFLHEHGLHSVDQAQAYREAYRKQWFSPLGDSPKLLR